jgi:hypothetical protein
MPDGTAEEVCPHCGVDLLGDPLPEQFQLPGLTRYRFVLAIEIRGVYDGPLFYGCPFCWGTWHRFDSTHTLWSAAEKYRAEFTEAMTTEENKGGTQ